VKTIERPSPNFNAREGVAGPDILLLHYTGMRSAEEAIARLTDAAAKVSAHYTVDEDGTVYAHVPEHLRAWHAGVSSWRGAGDINSRSVGIEIVNPGHEFGYRPFPDAQIAAVIELGRAIVARHRVPRRNVIGHSDVAPGRKTDPGELFPWKRLAESGLGIWVEARGGDDAPLTLRSSGPAVATLQQALASYGYGIEATGAYDERTVAVVEAFQRHFRQSNVDGIADAETQAILRALISVLDRAV
jgi:N-acetylmuramoyl-L-alanine amidase